MDFAGNGSHQFVDSEPSSFLSPAQTSIVCQPWGLQEWGNSPRYPPILAGSFRLHSQQDIYLAAQVAQVALIGARECGEEELTKELLYEQRRFRAS